LASEDDNILYNPAQHVVLVQRRHRHHLVTNLLVLVML